MPPRGYKSPTSAEDLDAQRRACALRDKYGTKPLARVLGVSPGHVSSACDNVRRTTVSVIAEWERLAVTVPVTDERQTYQGLPPEEGDRYRAKLRALLATCDKNLLARELGTDRGLQERIRTQLFSRATADLIRGFERRYGNVVPGFQPPAHLRKVPQGTRKMEAAKMRAAMDVCADTWFGDGVDITQKYGAGKSMAVFRRPVGRGPRTFHVNGNFITAVECAVIAGTTASTIYHRAAKGRVGVDLIAAPRFSLSGKGVRTFFVDGNFITAAACAAIAGTTAQAIYHRAARGCEGSALIAPRGATLVTSHHPTGVVRTFCVDGNFITARSAAAMAGSTVQAIYQRAARGCEGSALVAPCGPAGPRKEGAPRKSADNRVIDAATAHFQVTGKFISLRKLATICGYRSPGWALNAIREAEACGVYVPRKHANTRL